MQPLGSHGWGSWPGRKSLAGWLAVPYSEAMNASQPRMPNKRASKPAFQLRKAVRLASHMRHVPAYDDKPVLTHESALTVASIVGRGTLREPWRVVVTDGTHFWHMRGDDIEAAGTRD